MSTVRAKTQKTITDLTDSYSVVLTSDSYVFPGSHSAALSGTCTTQVMAFAGGQQVACSVNVNAITKPTGINVTSDNDSTAPTLTVTASTSFTQAGDVIIPVVITGTGVTVTKRFSVAIAFSGTDGDDGEDAVNVYIHSSNGMAFKNDDIDTVFTVFIYYGATEITNQSQLVSAFGNGSYLQWRVRPYGASSYNIISSSDSRLSDNGFTLTITSDDVDVQAVFNVQVIVPD